MAAKFVSKLTFSLDDFAAADQLEPALESLLRSLKVHDSVIMAVRVNEVLDRVLFTNLAQDEQQLKKCGKAFGIDTTEDAEFSHQRKMAKLIGAWRQSKTQSEVKQAADAAARVHGEPVGILAMDWNSLMEKFPTENTVPTSVKTNFLLKATLRSSKKVSPKDGLRQRGCGTWCRKVLQNMWLLAQLR